MTKKTPLHPMAVGGPRPKPTTRGRPAKQGDRYPNGRLKPEKPNAKVLAIRAALGVSDPRTPCTPLRVAYERGWISDAQYGSGRAYAGVYSRAQLGSPGALVVSDTAIQSGVEDVPDVPFNQMSRKIIAQIWDSAMRDVEGYRGPEQAEERAAGAMRRWKEMANAMTQDERREVELVCLRESWPQWMIQRSAGHFNTAWERGRDLLISGLGKMSVSVIRRPIANDVTGLPPRPANDHSRGRLQTEETLYVDQDGKTVLTVERRGRKPAA